MRINSNQSIASELAAEGTARSGKSSKASGGNFSANEGASFSGDTANVGGLTTLALQAPEVRQDRVSALREAVRNGSYQIDAGSIADAMMREPS